MRIKYFNIAPWKFIFNEGGRYVTFSAMKVGTYFYLRLWIQGAGISCWLKPWALPRFRLEYRRVLWS